MGLKLANTGETEENTAKAAAEGGNPWDFDTPERPLKTMSVTNIESYDTVKKQDNNTPILVLGEIIAYLVIICDICAIVWALLQPRVSILSNMQKIQGIFSAATIILIIEAILVNVFYKKKISLIFTAGFIGVLYPWFRNKHVKGSAGFGPIILVAYLAVFAAYMAAAMSAFQQYGDVLKISDEALRNKVVTVLEQPDETGSTMGKRIGNCMAIKTVQEDGDKIAFWGMGSYYIDKGQGALVETMDASVATQMLLVLKDGKYQLDKVYLDGEALEGEYYNFYWQHVFYR